MFCTTPVDRLGGRVAETWFRHINMAKDVQEALNMLSRELHHLIISDFNMPIMDGLLKAVRENASTKKSAFIILTAHGDPALVQKAAELGANNVLAKPFIIGKIKSAIEAVFGVLELRETRCPKSLIDLFSPSLRRDDKNSFNCR